MTCDDDHRVDEAIAEYLAACDAGRPMEREVFLARHPEIAENLRSFLDDHARMRCLAGDNANLTRSLNSDRNRAGETATVTATTSDGALGALLGYRIVGELGGGGQGVVYRALQVGLNREVALKRIRAGAAAPASSLNRFWTEAESLGRLRHPNIVQVYDFGRENGEPYLCMELLTGGCLAERLEKGPLPPREAAELVRTLAYAVQAAHDAGVVHRDLKPSNILFDMAGVPKLADFGLAKLDDAGGTVLTEEGALLGTYAYMAPEQAAGLSAAAPADIHALGIILYESLTGLRPFRADAPSEILPAVINRRPDPPSSILPGCPRDLDIVCLRCLQKSPADRYPSARDLAEDLGRWLRGESVSEPGLGTRLKQWAVQKPILAANLIALVVLYAIHLVCRYAPLELADPGNWFHIAATAVALIWAGGVVLRQWLSDKPRWSTIADYGWGATQVMLLTVLLWADRGPASALVAAYPLLVAGSTLTSGRIRLVWYRALLCVAGYSCLVVGSWVSRPDDQISAFAALSFVAMLLLLALIQDLLLRGPVRRR